MPKNDCADILAPPDNAGILLQQLIPLDYKTVYRRSETIMILLLLLLYCRYWVRPFSFIMIVYNGMFVDVRNLRNWTL